MEFSNKMDHVISESYGLKERLEEIAAEGVSLQNIVPVDDSKCIIYQLASTDQK